MRVQVPPWLLGEFCGLVEWRATLGPEPGDGGSIPSPAAIRLGGETEIIRRFERRVPGSNPGRGTDSTVR